MNKLAIYGMLLAGALLIPREPADLGKMKPVEAVFIYIEEEQVVIETDTEDLGRGTDVYSALANLKETTSGTVYLDTADYLLVGKGAEQLVPQIEEYLKGSVGVCSAQRAVAVAESPSYLSVHKPASRLRDYKQGTKLEELCVENGRLLLKRK